MIRLIVSDIDGTLLPEGQMSLDPEYMKVIRKLNENGIVFAAASGRQVSSMKHIFSPVDDCIFYISDNGGTIREQDKTLLSRSIEPEDLTEIVRELRRTPGIKSILSYQDGYYIEEFDEDLYNMLFHQYHGTGGVVDSFLDRPEGCVKISLYTDDDPGKYIDKLREQWGNHMTVNISGKEWIDLSHKKATKGDAVSWLQKYLNVTPEETMVFGDNFNDISMFGCALQSYASIHSHPDVKKEARYTFASFEENGVLKVLKQILELKKL